MTTISGIKFILRSTSMIILTCAISTLSAARSKQTPCLRHETFNVKVTFYPDNPGHAIQRPVV